MLLWWGGGDLTLSTVKTWALSVSCGCHNKGPQLMAQNNRSSSSLNPPPHHPLHPRLAACDPSPCCQEQLGSWDRSLGVPQETLAWSLGMGSVHRGPPAFGEGILPYCPQSHSLLSLAPALSLSPPPLPSCAPPSPWEGPRQVPSCVGLSCSVSASPALQTVRPDSPSPPDPPGAPWGS